MFHDLYRQQSRPVDGVFPADRRGEMFPDCVASSRHLHLWAPGDPIPDQGARLLIGVAMWSGYDLNLLDVIEAAPLVPGRIDVFDVDTVRPDPTDLRQYIPGFVVDSHTPFVGLWLYGRLVESASGYAARQLVTRVCHLDPAVVEGVMQSVLTRT